MKRNLGNWDRAIRALGAFAMGAVALFASLPTIVTLALLANASYLLFTALAGTCLGYALLGRSTCALESRR
ncbi:MAG: YgaP family membrane protein [Myxococcota bacterium]